MRIAAIAAACLVLGGCTDADWDNAFSYLPMEHERQTADANPAPAAAGGIPAPAPAMQPTQAEPGAAESEAAAPSPAQQSATSPDRESMSVAQTDDAHCRAVATQRATDGGYMGMDKDQQKQEYDLTYANCVAWDKAHAYRP